MRIIHGNFAVLKLTTMQRIFIMCVLAATFIAVSCERVEVPSIVQKDEDDKISVRLDEVAEILAMIPVQQGQMGEVHDAVTASSENGYDEEYTMRNLFVLPGSGVGDTQLRSEKSYERPLRALIDEQVRSMSVTKALSMEPDRFLEALTESDIQIYWPYSDEWDGTSLPVVTFDPEDGAAVNKGYRLLIEDDGSRRVEEVVVDEEMAKETPVWVVNRNDDADYTSLEMLRRDDPQWGEGGGAIIVNPTRSTGSAPATKAGMKTLILRDFTMNRNYDSWFAGASEFFVKIGYIGDFTASTEAELRLYNPMVTDFMVVVRRSQMGEPQNFNAILMTDWSDRTDACAFMITEDDGGTRTEWVTKAKVFIEGKSYGVEITLPLNVRDDIVWRGKLDYGWFEKCNLETWPFGDVDLTFEIVEN